MYINIFEAKYSRQSDSYVESDRIITVNLSDVSAICDEQVQASPNRYCKIVLSNGFRWTITTGTGSEIRSLLSDRCAKGLVQIGGQTCQN